MSNKSKSNFFAALDPFRLPTNRAMSLIRLVFAGVTIVSMSLTSTAAKADLFFDISENLATGQVDVVVSGSLDLDALAANPNAGVSPLLFLDPAGGLVSVGNPVGFDLFGVNTPFTPFGTGAQDLFGTGGTGDRVGLFTGQEIGLPAGYVSNTPLSGTSSFNGSFNSFGLIPGLFETPLDSGVATDSVFVNIGPIFVPEPSAFVLLTAMAGGLMTRRRRKPLV